MISSVRSTKKNKKTKFHQFAHVRARMDERERKRESSRISMNSNNSTQTICFHEKAKMLKEYLIDMQYPYQLYDKQDGHLLAENLPNIKGGKKLTSNRHTPRAFTHVINTQTCMATTSNTD